MVEVKGERVLTASCIRKPTAGMEVSTQTERAAKSRQMVFELLASNMRPREQGPDNQAPFWQWASSMGIAGSDRYASKFDAASTSTSRARRLESRDRGESRRVHLVRRVRARVPRGAGQRRHRHGAARQPRRAGVRHPRPDGALDVRHVRRVRAGVPDRRAVREVVDGQDGDEARRAEVRQGRRTRCARSAASAVRRPWPSRTTASCRSTVATATRTRIGSASKAGSATTTSLRRSA